MIGLPALSPSAIISTIFNLLISSNSALYISSDGEPSSLSKLSLSKNDLIGARGETFPGSQSNIYKINIIY